MCVLLFTLCAGTLFAGGFALSGIGSRAISMGGAFRGLADDPTAMYWNPAGLGFMQTNVVAVAGAGILPGSEFTNSKLNSLMPVAANQPLEGFTFDKVTAESKVWLFPNVFAVRGGECKWKYGLGIYVPYGLGAEWDAFKLPTQMPNSTGGMTPLLWSSGFPEKEMSSSIGIVDAHPTVAYQVMDNLSVGAGVSVLYGMIGIKKVKPHVSTTGGASYGYYLPTTMDLEGTGMGFGGNLGAIYKVNDALQIGLSGKLPASVEIKGDAEVTTWLSNAMNYALHSNNAAYFVPATSGGKVDAKATLNLPADVGLGASYKVLPNLRVNADFAYTMWSSLDKITIELDPLTILDNAVADPVMETKWEDTFRASLGGEYLLNKLALRAGFFFDQSPIPDSSLSPTWPDISDKLSGNLGAGYNFGPVTVDANFEYISFSEREITTPTADNMPGTYNASVTAFNLGVTYPF